MTSEEQYLDELLNSMNNSTVKERTMDEVLREMVGDTAAKEESVTIEEPIMEDDSLVTEEPMILEEPIAVEMPEVVEEAVILEEPIEVDLPETVEEPVMFEEPIAEETSEIIEEPTVIEETVKAPTEDDLAAMLDNLDLDALSAEVTNDISDSNVQSDDTATEHKIDSDSLADMLDMLDTENFFTTDENTSEEISEEDVSKEEVGIPTDEDLAAMLEGLDLGEEISEGEISEGEIPTEEIATEEIPEESIIEETPVEEPIIEETIVEEETPEAEAPVTNASEESSLDNLDMEFTEDDLARMFAEATGEAYVEPNKGDLIEPSADIVESDEPNVVDKLDNIGDSDEDLLALLEGIDEMPGTDDSEDEISALLGDDDEKSSKKKKKEKKSKKEKKPFKLPFLKKKESAENEDTKVEDSKAWDSINVDGDISEDELDQTDELVSEDTNEMDDLLNSIGGMDESSEIESLSEDEIDGLDDIKEKGSKKKKKSKKNKEPKEPGFLAKLIMKLTEEIDDEETDGKSIDELSNEDIIAEVDAENANLEEKGKKTKKPKKEKKAKKGKKGDAPAEGEGEEGAADNKKAKKKKEKKPKEPKEPKEKIPSKKILSKKAFIGLIAFCATLVAATVILSSILPDYADTKKAREAFYKQDYETVYNNLYNKKLNSSDRILFERSKTYLAVKKRYDAYLNKKSLGFEVEALDSLLEGVYVYQNVFMNADSYIKPEIDIVYNNILSELSDKYNLNFEDSIYIYTLDSAEYTKILNDIVNKGSWSLESENTESEIIDNETKNDNTEDSLDTSVFDNLADVLPEEEDLNI